MESCSCYYRIIGKIFVYEVYFYIYFSVEVG